MIGSRQVGFDVYCKAKMSLAASFSVALTAADPLGDIRTSRLLICMDYGLRQVPHVIAPPHCPMVRNVFTIDWYVKRIDLAKSLYSIILIDRVFNPTGLDAQHTVYLQWIPMRRRCSATGEVAL